MYVRQLFSFSPRLFQALSCTAAKCQTSTPTAAAGLERKAFLELVRALRQRTDAPLTDCRTALEEAGSDVEKAMGILRRKGKARAMHKQGRSTAHGLVVACLVEPAAFLPPAHPYEPSLHTTGGAAGRQPPRAAGAIISLCVETDFAARNAHFQTLCQSAQAHMRALIISSAGSILRNPVEATQALQQVAAEDVTKAAGVLGENVKVASVLPFLVEHEETSSPTPDASGTLTCSPPASSKNSVVVGWYTHGGVSGVSVGGRLVGLVALERRAPPPPHHNDHSSTSSMHPNDAEEMEASEEEGEMAEVVGAVARHFVATSGEADEMASPSTAVPHRENGTTVQKEEGGLPEEEIAYLVNSKYAHQPFFGASAGESGRVETVGQWLKHRGMKLLKAVVLEFGKTPILSVPPVIPPGKGKSKKSKAEE